MHPDPGCCFSFTSTALFYGRNCSGNRGIDGYSTAVQRRQVDTLKMEVFSSSLNNLRFNIKNVGKLIVRIEKLSRMMLFSESRYFIRQFANIIPAMMETEKEIN